MKTIYLSACIILNSFIIATAQDATWMAQKHILDKDIFYESAYVNSTAEPIIVNLLLQETPPVPNGPSYPQHHYATAYNTSGLHKWTKELIGARPLDVLSVMNDKFYLIAIGTDTIQFGTQSAYSPHVYPANHTIYILEIDNTGSLINYGTFGISSDIYIIISDIVADRNNDLILCGTLFPDQLSAVPFTYGAYSAILDPDEKTFFVSRLSTNGIPGNIFTFNSPRFIQTYTVPQQVVADLQTGDIVFLGRFGDSLTVNGTMHSNNTGVPQFFAGLLAEDLSFIDFEGSLFSTNGTILNEAAYNQATGSIYFSGTWGNELFYIQASPLQGHSGTMQNGFVARLNSGQVRADTIITFIPQTNLFTRYVTIDDIHIDATGNLYLSGAITDSSVRIGNTVHTLNNADPLSDHEALLIKINPDLSFDTIIVSDDDGNALFTSITGSEDKLFCTGSTMLDFTIGALNANSTFATTDALIVCFSKDQTTAISEAPMHNTLLIYPNPSEGIINIKMTEDSHTATLQLRNTLGQVVFEDKINGSCSYNFTQLLKAGMYAISVIENEKTTTGKLIVK